MKQWELWQQMSSQFLTPDQSLWIFWVISKVRFPFPYQSVCNYYYSSIWCFHQMKHVFQKKIEMCATYCRRVLEEMEKSLWTSSTYLMRPHFLRYFSHHWVNFTNIGRSIFQNVASLNIYTCSWEDKLIILWVLNRKVKTFWHIEKRVSAEFAKQIKSNNKNVIYSRKTTRFGNWHTC